MIKKLVLIVLGLLLIVFAVRHLSLVYAGDMAGAVIDEVNLKKVKPEIQGGRSGGNKLTGRYILQTEVKYCFDVYPTSLEAIKTGSESPLYTGVRGRDTMSDISSYKYSKYSKGDQLNVLYLRPLPQINAAYQPKNLTFYGWAEMSIAVLLLVWGILSKKKSSNGTVVDD